MKLRTARAWLAIYFLLSAAFIGAFLILFRRSPILPLEVKEANATFQIIIPVLIAQVTIVFQWLAKGQHDAASADKDSPVPSWALVLPPILAVGIFLLAAVALALSNRENAMLQVSPEAFQSAVTLAVTILNASTVMLVGRLFPGHRR